MKENMTHNLTTTRPVPIFVVLMTILYGIVVIGLSTFHEVWRDEVAIVSVAKEAGSVTDLYRTLKHFGHPGLWPTILYPICKIFPTYRILPVVNIAVCISAIFIFLTFAPFDRVFKSLFVAGVLPLYVYPI